MRQRGGFFAKRLIARWREVPSAARQARRARGERPMAHGVKLRPRRQMLTAIHRREKLLLVQARRALRAIDNGVANRSVEQHFVGVVRFVNRHELLFAHDACLTA